MPLADAPRVGYVVKRYPRYSETFIVNEILAHEAAGLDVNVFALRPSVDTHFQERLALVRAPVHYLPGETVKAGDFWSALGACGRNLAGFWDELSQVTAATAAEVHQAAALALACRRLGIDHLHAHFATSATAVARLAARFADLSYSFTAHAKDIFHESVQAESLAQLLHDASAAVTVSDYNVAHLTAQFGDAAARVQRIYNGLDLAMFPFALPRGRPRRIVAVGRLIEKKGFRDLIAACWLLAQAGGEWECQIVGEGEQEPLLAAQIAELGLEGRVAMLGPRPQAEVARLVQAAAVFAAPCVVAADGNRDGLPTVLLEAMALGTPCVATDVTGIPEVVRDNDTGLVVPQHEAAALARAIARLLDDEALGVRLAQAARRLIEREFDVHVNTARLRELFAAATGRGTAAGRMQEVA